MQCFRSIREVKTNETAKFRKREKEIFSELKTHFFVFLHIFFTVGSVTLDRIRKSEGNVQSP